MPETPSTASLARRIELWHPDRLNPYAGNAKLHPDRQVERIAASIVRFGFNAPILVDAEDGIIAGHGRLLAARRLGLEEVPVVVLDHLDGADRKAYLYADNRLAETGWDEALLGTDLAELEGGGYDLDALGWTGEELERLTADLENGSAPGGGPGGGGGETPADPERPWKTLTDRFLVPPFSVLDGRRGYWTDRKKAWLELGLSSGDGRAENLLGYSATGRDTQFYIKKRAVEAELGRELTTADFLENHYTPTDVVEREGTSLFDPVLAEIAVRWFCPPGGKVLDPFAGGSVRGIVSAVLGRQYLGVDIRPEQVQANQEQLELAGEVKPEWRVGDARKVHEIAQAEDFGPADLILTCPPYGDLEVYSELEDDLSAMKAPAFDLAIAEAFESAIAALAPDRFAFVVVGDIRDDRGLYRRIPGTIIAACERAGASLYNEAVYLRPIGALPVRVRRPFEVSRKIGKGHEDVLVFVKGDPRKATAALADLTEEDFGLELSPEAAPAPDPLLEGLGGEIE